MSGRGYLGLQMLKIKNCLSIILVIKQFVWERVFRIAKNVMYCSLNILIIVLGEGIRNYNWWIELLVEIYPDSWCFISRFLLQCLEDLDTSLRKLNSRLFVLRGQPTDLFPKIFKVTALRWYLCCQFIA